MSLLNAEAAGGKIRPMTTVRRFWQSGSWVYTLDGRVLSHGDVIEVRHADGMWERCTFTLVEGRNDMPELACATEVRIGTAGAFRWPEQTVT